MPLETQPSRALWLRSPPAGATALIIAKNHMFTRSFRQDYRYRVYLQNPNRQSRRIPLGTCLPNSKSAPLLRPLYILPRPSRSSFAVDRADGRLGFPAPTRSPLRSGNRSTEPTKIKSRPYPPSTRRWFLCTNPTRPTNGILSYGASGPLQNPVPIDPTRRAKLALDSNRSPTPRQTIRC